MAEKSKNSEHEIVGKVVSLDNLEIMQFFSEQVEQLELSHFHYLLHPFFLEWNINIMWASVDIIHYLGL